MKKELNLITKHLQVLIDLLQEIQEQQSSVIDRLITLKQGLDNIEEDNEILGEK
jgi:hypothetical protein